MDPNTTLNFNYDSFDEAYKEKYKNSIKHVNICLYKNKNER